MMSYHSTRKEKLSTCSPAYRWICRSFLSNKYLPINVSHGWQFVFDKIERLFARRRRRIVWMSTTTTTKGEKEKLGKWMIRRRRSLIINSSPCSYSCFSIETIENALVYRSWWFVVLAFQIHTNAVPMGILAETLVNSNLCLRRL